MPVLLVLLQKRNCDEQIENTILSVRSVPPSSPMTMTSKKVSGGHPTSMPAVGHLSCVCWFCICVISASLLGEPQVQMQVRWLLSVARGFSDGCPWVHAEAGAQSMGWKLAAHRQMRPMGFPAFGVCNSVWVA